MTVDASSEPVVVRAVTLEVTPDEGETLLKGKAAGSIQLALRNPLDTQQHDMASVNTGALYRGSAAAPPPVVQKIRASKHNKTVVQAPAGSSVYTIEVIEGDKKETEKF